MVLAGYGDHMDSYRVFTHRKFDVMTKYKKGQKVTIKNFMYDGIECGEILQDDGERVLVVFDGPEVGVWVPKVFIRKDGE